MSRINSKSKGSLGERQVRDRLNTFLLPSGEPVVAERGCQHAGGVDTPDVKHNIPNLHLEVKRTETMSPSKARESLDQAKRDAGTNLPIVVWRSNRTDWCALMTFDDLLGLLGCKSCGPDSEEEREIEINGK